MPLAIVKFAFKSTIDASSQGSFEKDTFNDSYSEFLMQAQAYNADGKFTTFREMIANNPKANSLHYKVGFAVGLYVKDLNNQIPGLLDSLGHLRLPFARHRFEIVASDLTNKSSHVVSITYETDPMTLCAIVGDHLVLALGDKSMNLLDEPMETFMFQMQPGLSIIEWKDVQCKHEREIV